jgi:DNA-binding NtrC family response regulator
LEQLLAIARTDSHILINVAREMDKAGWARIAHEHSRRATAPMVSVNCAEIASRGWENALFGQMEMPGSAADPAVGDPLAAADGGTLFLDEVHALSLASQVKLLRLLEEKQYRRLAETFVRRADVRVIGATNTDISAAVRAGRFRADLFAHFQIASLTLPFLWRIIAAVQALSRTILAALKPSRRHHIYLSRLKSLTAINGSRSTSPLIFFSVSSPIPGTRSTKSW